MPAEKREGIRFMHSGSSKFIGILLLLFLLLVGAALASADADMTLALLGFDSVELREDAEKLFPLVEYRLSVEEGIILVERQRIDRLLEELGLSYAALVRSSSRIKAGSMLGADLVAFGTLERTDPHLCASVRVVDVQSGCIVDSFKSIGSASELSGLASRIATRIAQAPKRRKPPDAKRVAFLPFSNQSMFGKFDFLEDRLAELCRTAISSKSDFLVLERESTEKLLTELYLREAGLSDSSRGPLPGNAIEADFMVRGQFSEKAATDRGGKWVLEITFEIWKLPEGQIVQKGRVEGEAERITETTVEAIEKELRQTATGRVPEAALSKSEAYELLKQGMLYVQRAPIRAEPDSDLWRIIQDYGMEKHIPQSFLKNRSMLKWFMRDDPRWSRELKKAIDCFENVVFLDPDNVLAKFYLGASLCELQENQLIEPEGRVLSEKEREKEIEKIGREKIVQRFLCGILLLEQVFFNEKSACLRRRALEYAVDYANRGFVDLGPTTLRITRLAFKNIDIFDKDTAEELKENYLESTITEGGIEGHIRLGRIRLAEMAKGYLYPEMRPRNAYFVFWGIWEVLSEHGYGVSDYESKFLREYYESSDPIYRYLAFFCAGEIFCDRGEHKRAQSFLRKAQEVFSRDLTKQPLSRFARSSRELLYRAIDLDARCCFNMKEPNKAVSLVEPYVRDSLEKNKFDEDIPLHFYSLLGSAYEEAGMLKDALGYYEKLTRMDVPDHVRWPRPTWNIKVATLGRKIGIPLTSERPSYRFLKLSDVGNATHILSQNDLVWIMRSGNIEEKQGWLRLCKMEGDRWNEVEAPSITSSRKICALALSDSCLWVGTYGDGLFRYNITTGKVTKYDDKTGLLSNYVTSLVSSQVRLFIGIMAEQGTVERGGILELDIESGKFTPLTTAGRANPETLQSAPLSMILSSDGTQLWVVVSYTGSSIRRYSLEKRRWEGPLGDTGTAVYQMLSITNGLILRTAGTRFARYDIPNDRWLRFPSGQSPNGWSFWLFGSHEDAYGAAVHGQHLWIYGRQPPLSRYDLKTGQVLNLREMPDEKEIITLLQCVQGNLVVGTGKAIYRLVEEK